MRVGVAALAMTAALAACGDVEQQADRPVVEGSAGVADTLTTPDTASGPEPASTRVVHVWFTRGDTLVAVPRPGAPDSLRAALDSLVAGPRPEDRRRGLRSWFGEETRDVLADVGVDGGRAIVDFRPALPTLVPGAGTSAGSEVLLGALDSTVFQFPWVNSVEYRLAGSCEVFWAWLQRECTVVRR